MTSTLVSISELSKSKAGGLSGESSVHMIRRMPVVVLFPHNQCNCRCVMCDIWRVREAREIRPHDLERELESFRKFGVRWVVLSGGEPQLNRQFPELAQMLRREGIRVTLLTAGLLLEAQADVVAAAVDDVIVSLDGPPAVHNRIRRVARAFEQLTAGIKRLQQLRNDMEIRGRCTVQKQNHQSLCATVRTAREAGLNSISFLAADVSSAAFNREKGWSQDRRDQVSLDAKEVEELNEEIERLVRESARELESGFVQESAEKLRRIVLHFRAQLGQTSPVAPRCNAPWVSAVIEATGNVRPCFFHPPLGNIHTQPLAEIVNGPAAQDFRANLNVATNPTCRRCVCSLHLADAGGR